MTASPPGRPERPRSPISGIPDVRVAVASTLLVSCLPGRPPQDAARELAAAFIRGVDWAERSEREFAFDAMRLMDRRRNEESAIAGVKSLAWRSVADKLEIVFLVAQTIAALP